ncbi:MAG: response regulator [Colwellia sp.]|nr:response regulator [Colwellia sp.]
MFYIEDKTFNVLCVEDDISTQKILKDYLTKKFSLNFEPQSTVLGAQRYIQAEPYDTVDLIVCDWMLPVWDASYLIKDLYSLGKVVIFFTCLEENDLKSRVKSIIGFYPKSFKYVQKATKDYLAKLTGFISEEIK